MDIINKELLSKEDKFYEGGRR